MKEEFYLDNGATTKPDNRVVDTIFETMRNVWGNPSSHHSYGYTAKDVLDKSRKTIAEYINCRPNEIIFTSGACEANTLAIMGYLRQCWHTNTILCTTRIEHKSIIAVANACLSTGLVYDGCVEFIDVDEYGFVDIDKLSTILSDIYEDGCHTPFVSIQAANSEIGTIQDIKTIADIVHKYNGIFHCDATQLFPYQRIDVKNIGIDMMSMSGHKINTPKGIGFLYVRHGIELEPIIYGSQMEARRGGTENIPYIVGLAKAVEIIDDKLQHHTLPHPYPYYVRNYMKNILCERIDDCIINGADIGHRLPNNINISFKGVTAESLMIMLDQAGVYVSAGSACNAGNNTPSYVLLDIGVPEDYVAGTIRITLPEDFTFEEADYVVSVIEDCVKRLRKFGEK